MALSIKNKIRLGTVFLFTLLILSGGLSVYYLLRLKADTANIIKDNYESLDYSRQMLVYLDTIHSKYKVADNIFSRFDSTLLKQEKNVTEKGELEATTKLRMAYAALQNGETSDSIFYVIRKNIHEIMNLNLQAIDRKNVIAKQTSDSVLSILIIIVVCSFIAGFTFIFNFPSIVVTPIKKLTEAITEISKKNYRHRIHLDNKDEFGQLADAFNTMTERLEEFESSNLNKIIFEKTRAEAVINSLKDASIGIDRSNRILFVNKQALHLLGLQVGDIAGKQTEDIAAKNDLFRFLLENDTNNPFKIVVDGKENYYIKETVDVAEGESNNKVIILKNITSFKELDVAKTDFIATISHELKTPLASSDFSLKLLEDERVPFEERSELIQQLKNDNQRMLRILSELLNMSQLEAGKIQLDIQAVDPKKIVANSVNALAATAKERSIEITIHAPAELPFIKADADKISWVLNNFLTNAIRYSSTGSNVVIAITRSGNKISFTVTDEGQGIDPLYQEKIFERYFQVPGRSDKKGSGIGLAICKEFIEAMGGAIWMKSEPGKGSSFGFTLSIA